MKTHLVSKSIIVLAAFALPVSAIAQADKPDPSKTTDTGAAGRDIDSSNKNESKTDANVGSGTTDDIRPSSAVGTAGTALLNDPSALFRKLDTDHDGKLTQEEFARLSSVMRQTGSAISRETPDPGTPRINTTDPASGTPR